MLVSNQNKYYFYVPYQEKKSGKKVTEFFTSDQHFFPSNFNPILFNPTPTFPTFLKPDEELFPIF